MDQSIEALQTYNGGIIFVSYLIAVIGALTTLELLQRRTHIRGYYNWFLLFAAACSMGGVGIWSMHFIGNNSLTITLNNGDQYQLSYSAGFTFASLVVAILTMFLAFTFVGITEEARIARIIPSGVIAGFGIVSMHYLGQVAIDFFQMRNKIAFVIGASIIAVCAVTAALFIFFKLREQWENQWYKRLGCAMLMGVAVCGTDAKSISNMHALHSARRDHVLPWRLSYRATNACTPNSSSHWHHFGDCCSSKLPFQKKPKRRLILDTIFFDTNGRILVKVDGVVPMKEVLSELPENDFHEKFSSNHPLFIRLFETAMQWSRSENKADYQQSNADNLLQNTQPTANLAAYNAINDSFIQAAHELVEELRLQRLSDLGFLFDSVMNANTISKKSMFSQEPKKMPIIRRTSSTASWLITSLNPKDTQKTNVQQQQQQQQQRRTSSYSASAPENATVIDIFNTPPDELSPANNSLTIWDADSEDRHIFLVKKIDSNKDLVNLLSIGFRFAEPLFISKTMGEKLKVPSEYMLNYFRDMQQMTEAAATMYTPIKSSGYSMYSSPTFKKQLDLKNSEVRSGVFVGLFALVEDQEHSNQVPYFIVDKEKRYTFPMVQLTSENGSKPTGLTRQQKNTILSLSGQSLANISNIDSSNPNKGKQSFAEGEDIQGDNNFSPISTQQSIGSVRTLIDTTSFSSNNASFPAFGSNSSRSTVPALDLEDANAQFIQSLEAAAKSLISSSSYGKSLATSAKLYGDVLDIPAFSLRAGHCQLILFRAHITTPGTRFAINQTLTETIKCIPFPMYRSFTHHITQVALEKYRAEESKYKTPASYLTQQRLYQSTAVRNNELQQIEDINGALSADQDDNDEDDSKGQHEHLNDHALTAYRPAPKGEPSPLQPPTLQTFSSLPPPPRVKRNKFAFPSNIGSLDISHISKDFLPSMLKGANNIPLSPVPPSSAAGPGSSAEAPIVLNLLPANARFWWLNNMYEETFNT
ncbi:hypothetical protein MAM1_0360c10024 [Mucor ambiguus]|uniref:MHYT domain-containing protein n=1 Tax=Mucor ambiguus TaxID=91626 RepID=A0A0C9N765_9FUNG|nr:hypothetical protein MAM1_0360c10024 [Mucor ambiguus]